MNERAVALGAARLGTARRGRRTGTTWRGSCRALRVDPDHCFFHRVSAVMQTWLLRPEERMVVQRSL